MTTGTPTDTPPDTPKARTCPFCGESVDDTDTVCPHCGESLVGG